jgi:hypothetical protein
MKLSAVYLLIIGVVWALAIGLMFLAMSSIAEPVGLLYTSTYYAALLVGPALLIIGSLLILRRSREKIAFILSAIGCLILTVTIARESILGLQVEPLQAKPPYVLFAILISATVAADLAAWRIYRRIVSYPHDFIEPSAGANR